MPNLEPLGRTSVGTHQGGAKLHAERGIHYLHYSKSLGPAEALCAYYDVLLFPARRLHLK